MIINILCLKTISVSWYNFRIASKSLRPSDAYMWQKTDHHWSDNGLSPGWRQTIIWTHAGI